MNGTLHTHNIRLKTIGTYAVVSLLIGALVVMLILLFTSLVNHQAFSYDGIRHMYAIYNVLYLINLIPLIFLISGGFYGNYIHENKHSYTQTIDQYASSIKKVIAFSKEIGKGNLAARFEAETGEEELRETLESMRQDLLEASKKENERNFIIRTIGEISTVLNSSNEIMSLSDKVLMYLVDKLEGAVQGAFYVVDRVEGEGEKYYEMTASYAYNRKKSLNAKFKFA